MNGQQKQPAEGFYFLHHKREKKPVLVHGYTCKDAGNVFGFGFNTHDGGGFLPYTDLSGDETIIPAMVETPVASFEITDTDAMIILETLLNRFETMKQEKNETREQFENREASNRSLIGIMSDIVTMSTKRKDGETAILKVVFRT